MVDDGELDWKVITIDASDPLAEKLNDVSDVDKHCPGVISGMNIVFVFVEIVVNVSRYS